MNEQNREAVRQWRAKAKSDWDTVEILTASRKCPADAVCLHCQQYVEKLPKALLTLHGVEALKNTRFAKIDRISPAF